jgi:carbon-monoxide dehydrogenase small subunit
LIEDTDMSVATRTIHFTLNGAPVSAPIATHHTLLEVVRDQFGLNGARESCGQGLCGCCTLVVNGQSVSGCLTLAATADGATVNTVESLADEGRLSPLQQAFVECGAFQCGFCTSGFLLMSTELLAQNANPTEREIRDYLSGNLCRCATYPEVIRAVKLAAERTSGAKQAA